MRIIHTADVHLESAFVKLTPSQVRERKNELYLTLGTIIGEAARIGAEAVIIAGDLFDTERISRRAAERVRDLIEKHADIDFLYLRGNHEVAAFTDKLAELPKNLKCFGDEWTYFEYGDVIISGRNTICQGMFSELKITPEKKNICVLHGAVKEHSGDSDGISLPEARASAIDYLALGHYHSYTAYDLGGGRSAVYCGTPEGRGFDEAGRHGFVLIDTDRAPEMHVFCPCAKREIRIVSVDMSDATSRLEIENRIERELAGIASSDLVRVLLTGYRAPETYIDTASLRAMYSGRFYYLDVKDETKMRIDPMAYAYDKSLKGEFIRLVLANDDLSDEMKDKIIRCGITALLGEDCEI